MRMSSAVFHRTLMNQKFASIVGFIALVSSIVLLLRREALFANGVISITIQCASFLLMIWARVAFGLRSFHASANPTQGGLVTSGPYRYIRHPIYAAALYFIWTGIVTHLSIINIILGVMAIGGVVMRILAEEKLIVVQYPEYGDYAARTKRILPFIM
jgi:protein-S-isoprenylcysteine O-methyltransferase Ste14